MDAADAEGAFCDVQREALIVQKKRLPVCFQAGAAGYSILFYSTGSVMLWEPIPTAVTVSRASPFSYPARSTARALP